MDKEQAKFILSGFRPDGSDTCDATFAAALHLAMEDRELGDWLANERAFDTAFSEALLCLQLPNHLRDELLQLLRVMPDSDAVGPILPGSEDLIWCNALAEITPPPDLRTRIFAAAMHSAATADPAASDRAPSWRKFRSFRFAWAAAAAAGIALAWWLAPLPDRSAPLATLSVDALQDGFIQTVAASSVRLEEFPGDHQEIIRHLKQQNLPCPCCLPPGLRNGQGVGCREIVIQGKRGSLVCLRCSDGKMIHLATFRRDDVSGELPCRERPQFSQNGDVATARWTDTSNVFILIGHTRMDSLAALF